MTGSGIIDNTAASTVSTLTAGDNDQTSTFNGVLQSSGGTLNLVKEGTGALVLGTANTFSGEVSINGGTLAFGDTGSLASVSSIAMSGGTTLRPDVVGAVVSAPITVGAIGTNATITAPSIAGLGGSNPVPVIFTGAISGDGDVTFSGIESKNAYGNINLNAANGYGGSTLITCEGSTNTQIFVNLGVENALPTTTVLTLDGGNGAGSGRTCQLDLKGRNQTLAGLTNVTGRTSRTQRIVNSSGTPATLTVNNADPYTYAAQLGNSGPNFGLAKGGAAALTLSGSLAYAGDTAVTEGLLSLGSTNGNNDLSTVTVASSGAKLRLDFAGSDTVKQFFIGANPQNAGTYGHTDSGATNGGLGVGALDAYFEAGAGTLTVTTGPGGGGYAGWAATNAPGQTPEEDFDGDGVANGVEYVLGGDKNTNDLDKLPTLETSSGDLIFTFFRDRDSIDGSTTVEIEVGTTLLSWQDSYAVGANTAASDTEVTVVENTPSGFDTVILTVGQAPDLKKFARLKVTP